MARAARMCGVGAVGLTVSLVAVSLYLVVSVGFTGDGFRLAVGGVFVAAVSLLMSVSLVNGSLALRRATTSVVLGGLALFLVWQTVSRDAISSPWLPRHLPFLIAGTMAATYGVACRRPWGRWLALGGGWAGVIGFAWIAVAFFAVHTSRIQTYVLEAWRTAVFLGGSALLVVGLCGREMRAYFGGPAGSLWNAGGVRVGLLRSGVLLSLASVPYLLMVGLGSNEPWSPRAARILALADAAFIAAGAVLLIRQRTVGVVVTCVGAIGVYVLILVLLGTGMSAAATWWGTLAPAVLGAVLCLAAVASPAWQRFRKVRRANDAR